MTGLSPLLPYANALLVVSEAGSPSLQDGRVIATASAKYLIQCYLKRQDSTGTTTGADYLPSQAGGSDMLPGVSGVVYLYRGYGLRYIEVDLDYQAGVDAVPETGWSELLADSKPEWLVDGASAQHLQSNEALKNAVLERTTGKFGGGGIDVIISTNIKGIPLVVRSGDVLN